jgi:hypothetical protein
MSSKSLFGILAVNSLFIGANLVFCFRLLQPLGIWFFTFYLVSIVITSTTAIICFKLGQYLNSLAASIFISLTGIAVLAILSLIAAYTVSSFDGKLNLFISVVLTLASWLELKQH